jgi:putative transposase
VKYRFISGETDYSTAKWAKHLNVSLSGYHSWKKNMPARESKLASLTAMVKKLFEDSGGSYGAERIYGKLRVDGYKASFHKVSAIMASEGLSSIHLARKRRSFTDSSKSHGEGFPDVIRGFEIEAPFQALSSDISYIRTGEGFEYLCQVRDVMSGLVLGWSISDRMKSDIVLAAISRAISNWNVPEGCIFHSDRGSQYTSLEVQEFLACNGLRQSFSRVGKPGDNAWSESFFANLKKEAVHWLYFPTRASAGRAMFAYIDGFYNTKRVQKRLGFLSPLDWLKQWHRVNDHAAA